MRRIQLLGAGKRQVLLAAAVLVPLTGVVGCTGANEPNGWLDPTAVGRFDDRRALVVPILSHMDIGLEEANQQFQSATEVRPEDLETQAEDYAISANDLLTISISDLVGPGAEQVRVARVTESGRVSLPMVGQVQASGLTEAELEQAIVEAYRNAGLIQNAQVSVTVTEARGRSFSIVGPGVVRPGQYPMYKADFRVLDALVAAGDVAPNSDVIYVLRDTSRRTATTRPATGERGTGAPGQQLEPAAPGAMLEPAQPGTAPEVAPTPVPPPAPTPEAAPATTAPAGPTDAEGTAAATATQPVAGEGRIVIIDGKPVLIEGGQTQVAAPQAQPPQQGGEAGATAAAPPTTQPGDVGTVAEAGAPAGTRANEPFEFNGISPDNQRMIRVSLRDLRAGSMRNNIAIRPGDMLIVPGPVVGEYYMGGHVARPGVYSMTGRDVTLTMAVVSAGMFDQIAIPRRTEITRRLGQDRQVKVNVDLDAVFAGTQPDMYLKPNDVVNVGTSAWAPFIASIRGAFRFTYGFGFLYDRNYAAQYNNENL